MILFISDVHLGEPNFCLEKELRSILQMDFEKIYILGDILDVWDMPIDEIEEKFADTIKMMDDLGDRAEVVLGNHDPSINRMRASLPSLKVHKVEHDIELDGKKVIMLHGHTCDTSNWSYKYTFAVHKFIRNTCGDSRYFGWVLSIADWVRYKFFGVPDDEISKYDQIAIERYRGRYDIIIMGHTHAPKILRTEDYTYINTGGFLQFPSYVKYDDKKFQLVSI